jgi:hypothetical protein
MTGTQSPVRPLLAFEGVTLLAPICKRNYVYLT